MILTGLIRSESNVPNLNPILGNWPLNGDKNIWYLQINIYFMFAITAAPCSKLSDYAYPIYPTHPHIIHPAHKLSISILNIPSKFSKYFSLGS